MTREQVVDVIIQEIERVAPLSGSGYRFDDETGCMDFDGVFRPIEMASAIMRLYEQ